jgi:hypothetical protein
MFELPLSSTCFLSLLSEMNVHSAVGGCNIAHLLGMILWLVFKVEAVQIMA